MADKCCENCVGLNEKLERVLKEVEELKRIITAQGIGIGTSDSESPDSEEKEDDPALGGYYAWTPTFRPILGCVSKTRPRPRRPYPNSFTPFTPSLPHPEPTPNSPSSPSYEPEPSPKRPCLALSHSTASLTKASGAPPLTC